MQVYRIVNSKFKESTLSGIGAEKVGGRWNEVGTRAVYCSENISLAFLEYYIHSKNVEYLPKDLQLVEIKIPDEFLVTSLDQLPKSWNNYPYTSNTTNVFTELVKDPEFFALKVPSSIVSLEFNLILNPLFSEFNKVKIVEFKDISIDGRL